jgi:protein FrlC
LKKNDIKVSSILPVPGGGPGGNIASANKDEREWSVQYAKDCCDLGVELGCRTLVCVAGWYIYGTKQQDAWNYALDSIIKIGQHASKSQVIVCIEPTASDSNLVESADDALMMKEQTGLNNTYVMFDVAHALYRNEPPTDYIYNMGKNLKHIHLTDYNRQPPGTAGCDFKAIMQALKDIGFDGYVTMETGFGDRGAHPDSCARRSLENLKEIEKTLE